MLDQPYITTKATMNIEMLNQIAEKVRFSLLNQLDREVDLAMNELGINEEISDSEWDSLVDMIMI